MPTSQPETMRHVINGKDESNVALGCQPSRQRLAKKAITVDDGDTH